MSPQLLLKLYQEAGSFEGASELLDDVQDIARLVERLRAVAEDDPESEAGAVCGEAADFIVALGRELAHGK